MADDANPRIFEGANNPPADPFEAIKAHIDDLYDEAKNWLDGQPIETDGQAEEVDKLQDMLAKAHKLADEARVKENEPYDIGKAAVQEKYAPLISDTKRVQGKTVKAIAACRAALGPWRIKKADEARQAADAARLEAEAKAAEAAAAIQATDAADLGAREAAEALVAEAGFAQREAARAERGATTGLGLTTYFEPVLVSAREAILHYMKDQPAEFVKLATDLAKADVRSGKRAIPGFTVEERKRAN